MNRQLVEASETLHKEWMLKALMEAKKSIPIPTAFCVGAVIVKDSELISTGYSRELPGNTHAEECALEKLSSDGAKGCSIYSTMEPCSKRLSTNRSCTSRIIEAGIKIVYLGVKEPDDFVVCEGIALLKEAGIDVYLVPSLEKECLETAKGQAKPDVTDKQTAANDMVTLSVKSSSQIQSYVAEVIEQVGTKQACVKLESSSSSVINKVISIAEIAKRTLKERGMVVHQYNHLKDASKGITNDLMQSAIAKDSDRIVPHHEPLLSIYLMAKERLELEAFASHQQTD